MRFWVGDLMRGTRDAQILLWYAFISFTRDGEEAILREICGCVGGRASCLRVVGRTRSL